MSPEVQLRLCRLPIEISTKHTFLDGVDDLTRYLPDGSARTVKQFVFFDGCGRDILPGSAFTAGVNT